MVTADAIEFIDTEAKAVSVKDKVKAFEDELTLVSQMKKFSIKDIPRIHFDKSIGEEIGKVGRIMGGSFELKRARQAVHFVFWREEPVAGLRDKRGQVDASDHETVRFGHRIQLLWVTID